MINKGELTDRTVTEGDPEPTEGEHLRKSVAVWARGTDELWRVVNLSKPSAHAYTWPVLIRCFKTMRVVRWP